MCAFTEPITDGAHPGARQLVTISALYLTPPNRVAFNYDVAVPVSLTGQGNAEGVLKGTLQVSLSFVPNPDPGPGEADFLHSVNNLLEGATADLLSNYPDLLPV